jgi:hypothetical protein
MPAGLSPIDIDLEKQPGHGDILADKIAPHTAWT